MVTERLAGKSLAIKIINLPPVLLLSMLLLVNAVVAAPIPYAGESLQFRAYYQGPFSAQKEISIADLHWQTRLIKLGTMQTLAMETKLNVSSEAYDFVEKLYPFRLQYRSLVQLQPMKTVAYERYDSTDDHGRELTWIDDSGRAMRFRDGFIDVDAINLQLPVEIVKWGSQSNDYVYYKPARYKAIPRMLDEVALLQKVRNMDLRKGAEFKMPVTDGKRRYSYQVFVLGPEKLQLGERVVDAIKIRFDGYRLKRGGMMPAHDSVWVWVSDDPLHTPLRIEHNDAIGRFVIDLTTTSRH